MRHCCVFHAAVYRTFHTSFYLLGTGTGKVGSLCTCFGSTLCVSCTTLYPLVGGPPATDGRHTSFASSLWSGRPFCAWEAPICSQVSPENPTCCWVWSRSTCLILSPLGFSHWALPLGACWRLGLCTASLGSLGGICLEALGGDYAHACLLACAHGRAAKASSPRFCLRRSARGVGAIPPAGTQPQGISRGRFAWRDNAALRVPAP